MSNAKTLVSVPVRRLALQVSAEGRASRQQWRKLRMDRAGQTCVIMGNGPSLRNTRFDLLSQVAVVGLNKVHLLADITDLQPDYVVAVNSLVIEQSYEHLLASSAALFLPTGAGRSISRERNVCLLPPGRAGTFATRPSAGFWEGFTVTYVALQVAYVLGFRRVVLIGVDHRFASSAQGRPNETVAASPLDIDHFHPKYFADKVPWQLPDLVNSERAYQKALSCYQRDGRSIVDATDGGALTVFPRLTLEEALAAP